MSNFDEYATARRHRIEIEGHGAAWNGSSFETPDEFQARLAAAREREDACLRTVAVTETENQDEIAMLDAAASKMATSAAIVGNARAAAQRLRLAAAVRLRAAREVLVEAQLDMEKAERALRRLTDPLRVRN